MRRPVIAALALLSGTAAGVFAFAGPALGQRPQRPPPESFAVMWQVVPDRPVAPTLWVTVRNTITSAKLEPRRAFALDAEARAADGALLLPAGAPLIWLAARTMAACGAEPPRERGLTAVWQFGTDRYICFTDQDRDGRFDQTFPMRTGTFGFLFGAGRLPRERQTIAPVAYSERSPDSVPNPPRLYVRYENFASFVGLLIFQVCFAERGVAVCLNPQARVRHSEIPVEFELLGGRFRVDAKVENRVQVTMVSPLVSQPLVIHPF